MWCGPCGTVLALQPQASRMAEHTGEARGFLVVRCAAAAAVPSGGLLHFPFPDLPAPPPPPARYVNKVESSTFVYFQVCGARWGLADIARHAIYRNLNPRFLI